MNCYENILTLLGVLTILILFYADATAAKGDYKRKVTVTYNPGCNIKECNNATASVNLIYAKAQGNNDSLHYVLSTVGHCGPTLLLLKSDDPEAVLKVNWTVFLLAPVENISGSVELVSGNDGSKVETYPESVIIFDRLIEYNDSTDEANLNVTTLFLPILLNQLMWSANTTDPAVSQIVGTTTEYPKTFSSNSSVSINFMPFGSNGQPDKLPSLPHNANSSDWELNLDSLLSRGNGSRFGVEMLLIGVGSNVSKSKSKSINDEYAPAVFTTEKMEWYNNNHSMGDGVQTFTQWRAVSYSTSQHERKFSTDVKTSNLLMLNQTSSQYVEGIMKNRLLRSYFAPERLSNFPVQSVISSFGKTEDGFYNATRYISWTSTIGFGTPPDDAFSTLIICMLLAGVGCPLLVIILGGVYVTYVKVKRRKRSSFRRQLVTNYDYQPINA